MSTPRQLLVNDLSSAMAPIPGDRNGQLSYYAACQRWLDAIGNSYFVIDEAPDALTNAQWISNFLFGHISDVARLIEHATASGLVSKGNPYSYVSGLRRPPQFAQFPAVADDDRSAELIDSGRELARLVQLEQSGQLSLDRDLGLSSQLSSLEFFYGGHASEEARQLLMQTFVDAEVAKRRDALQAVQALDFSRRAPRVLFSLEGPPTGKPSVVLCWLAMPDATSFSVRRVDLLDGAYRDVTLTPGEARLAGSPVEEHVRVAGLSFYPTVGVGDACAFHDTDVDRDRLYSYTVRATQRVRPGNVSLFGGPSSPVALSPAGQVDLRALIVDEVTRLGLPASFADHVSPYPSLSRKLFGTEDYDWLIASTTLKAAQDRGEGYQSLRSLSYVGATADTALAAAADGRLLAPADPAAVMAALGSAVGSYGVSQVLKHCLESAGLLLLDSGDPTGESFVGRLVRIVDPVTATVRPADLYKAVTAPLSTGGFGAPVQEVSNTSADTILQGALTLPAGDGLLDLTTADGIGAAIRTVRWALDFSRRRG